MKEILIEKAVVRDNTFLYYIDGEGNVCRSKRNFKGRGKKVEDEEKPVEVNI